MITTDRMTARPMIAPQGHPTHPKGSRARVLLASVFGPYAQDDEYGSRVINPMELYHNQVTRAQGPFSLRIFHRSWGLMMIQSNIEAPCALLDFPDLDRFVEELRRNVYEVVGISSILVNLRKVKKMCELVREHLPGATIVIGGHIANLPDLADRIDADFIVQGEGVGWFRRFLGEDPDRPYRHPLIETPVDLRNMGIDIPNQRGDTAATLIPSVGCPLGCNFCSTSAMFGGRGKFNNFYDDGDELYDVMEKIERESMTRSFFIMDENFLLHKKRSLRLLELMQQHDKSWSFYVFSSVKVLRSYTIEQLVALGVSWVWMGLEGEDSQYLKLRGIDTHGLIGRLQSHGIRVLGSTIIGLEDHTPDNIDAAIDHAVSHDTDFHQFMLYTPLPGTPLHAQLSAEGRIRDESECDIADMHGQYRFNYRHPHIQDAQEEEMVLRAFRRDFEVNGPSITRIVRTTLQGWQRYKNHPDRRIRSRIAWEGKELATAYAAVVAAAKRHYRMDRVQRVKMSALLDKLYAEFGWRARVMAAIGGPYVHWKMRREEKRLAAGWTREPPTFFERNHGFEALGLPVPAGTDVCRYVTPAVTIEPHVTTAVATV